MLGAMPQMFGVMTVSDAIAMGTEAMKYSLVYFQVFALPAPAPKRAPSRR